MQETADAVAHLIGWDTPISLFSATMSSLNKCGLKWRYGWGFVPDVFLAYLAERGVDKTILKNSVSIIPDDY